MTPEQNDGISLHFLKLQFIRYIYVGLMIYGGGGETREKCMAMWPHETNIHILEVPYSEGF